MTEPETTLTDGSPVTPDHRELKPNGQQKAYVVLSAEERAKGFVRSVRDKYKHVGRLQEDGSRKGGCGQSTTMGWTIAETYARDPKFYGGTFCCSCGIHKAVSEFFWDGTDEEVGS